MSNELGLEVGIAVTSVVTVEGRKDGTSVVGPIEPLLADGLVVGCFDKVTGDGPMVGDAVSDGNGEDGIAVGTFVVPGARDTGGDQEGKDDGSSEGAVGRTDAGTIDTVNEGERDGWLVVVIDGIPVTFEAGAKDGSVEGSDDGKMETKTVGEELVGVNDGLLVSFEAGAKDGSMEGSEDGGIETETAGEELEGLIVGPVVIDP